MKATFKDVAKLAGVSTQTVSRVTSGANNVAEKTRKKVLAAIAELNYVPNKGAQLLSRSKIKTLGLITLSIDHHGATLIANGIRQQAEKMHYGLVLHVVTEQDDELTNAAIKELKAQQIEHIIINLPLSRQQAEQYQALHHDVTFVFMDVPQDSRVNQVYSSHQQGAQQAAQLMLSQGRERFLLIAGPSDSNASSQRLQGWEDAIHKHNAKIIDTQHGDWKASSGYQLTRQALEQSLAFDAILVANDQMALGVLRALHEFHRKVPSQIAVIGFDDTPDSAYYFPPLSSIRQDFLSLGLEAVNMILNTTDQPTSVQIPTQLIERQSTALRHTDNLDTQAIRQLLHELDKQLAK